MTDIGTQGAEKQDLFQDRAPVLNASTITRRDEP